MKAVQTLFNPKFFQRIEQIDELAGNIRNFFSIPDEIVLYPMIKQTQLLIFTDSKFLINQMQFQQTLLYESLCKHLNTTFGLSLKSVHTKLISTQIASLSNERKPKKLSKQVKKMLKMLEKDLK